MEWKEIPLNEMKGFKIGHEGDPIGGSGCTVIVFDKKALCGVDIRGGGPASRETALLNPLASNDGVNAILLSGGSAYGLDAAGGVMRYLEEQGQGVKVGNSVVPIVVGSCIFDLNCADAKVRPDATMGYKACLNSAQNLNLNGNVGAGIGATVGKILGNKRAMKSGLGTYAVKVGLLTVGAIVIVNALGDVYAVDSAEELAGLLNEEKTKAISSTETAVKLLQLKSCFTANTTIGAILTNAKLDKAAMNKVAALASNGIARTIRPVNTSMDGDSIYAATTAKVKSSSDVVGTIGAYVLAKAINNAVLSAEDAYGFKAARSLKG